MSEKHIPIEVSACHIHLSQEDLDVLFGQGYELKSYRALSQPGQFASDEKLVLETPAGMMENVRIVGPVREHTQVELAWTDAVRLGLRPPVRISGDLSGALPVTIRGPKGVAADRACVIVAQRHIHLNLAQAKELGVEHGSEVSVRIGGVRETVFEKVAVRVHDNFDLRLHLDTDEGNACGATFEPESVSAMIV